MISIILLIFLASALFYLIAQPQKFLYGILVFNVLIDTVTGFVDPGESASNNILAIGRAAIILLLLIIYFKYYKTTLIKEFTPVLIFIILVTVLVPFSSKILTSLSGSLKIIITYSLLPIGYYFFNTQEKIYRLNKTLYWVIFIIILNFILANIFGIGQTSYSSSVEFYAGGFHIGGLNTLALCLILVPFIYKTLDLNKRKIFILLVPLLIIFLVISMKRASIFAGFLGLLIYIWYSKEKANLVKVFLFIGTIIVLAYPLYADVLEEQLFAREKQLQVDVFEKERRYMEILVVADEIINSANTLTFLFGKEIFNTIGNYAGGTFGPRALHTDIAQVLNGTGITGFFLFLYIYFFIFNKFKKLRKKADTFTPRNDFFYSSLKPLFISLFIASLAISFSEGILAVTYRSVLFIYLGAIMGTYKNVIINNSLVKI